MTEYVLLAWESVDYEIDARAPNWLGRLLIIQMILPARVLTRSDRTGGALDPAVVFCPSDSGGFKKLRWPTG